VKSYREPGDRFVGYAVDLASRGSLKNRSLIATQHASRAEESGKA
jgi:hypothetical protein